MDSNLCDMLVEQAQSAAQRTRWVLSAAMIISIAQIGAAYNFSFGFLRQFSEQMIFGPQQGSARLTALQDLLMRSWVDQLSVNVNIFGIKFSVADASLVGAISLLIISVWLFYSARRENHIIGKACLLAVNAPQTIKAKLFHGLCNTQLFGTVSLNDAPIRSLDGNVEMQIRSARIAVATLYYLPPITAFAMIATDLSSVWYLKAVFRGFNGSLFSYATQENLWDSMAPHFYITTCIEVLLALVLCHIVNSASKYQAGTISLFRELQKRQWDKFPTDS